MLCPVCDISLELIDLSDELKAHHCKQCDGNWLPSFQYWKWLNEQEVPLPEKEPDFTPETSDNLKAKFCPECKQILSRFKAGHGTAFYIERCGTCAGMWFDHNEWETLQTRNLHDDLHFIFGQPWQQAIREAAKQAQITTRLEELLGKEKFMEAQRIKNWLKDDAQKGEILAYLRSD